MDTWSFGTRQDRRKFAIARQLRPAAPIPASVGDGVERLVSKYKPTDN
jgi:hypothetical protein